MKKSFMTGLVLLLPITITVLLTLFFINLLTKPFQGFITYLLTEYNIFDQPLPNETLIIISKIIVLIFLCIAVCLVGLLASSMFIRYFIDLGDKIVHRIPLVNKIYKATQDVMKTVFEPSSNSFSQVVLAPFPKTTTWCIGLVTSENQDEHADEEHMGMLSVFVPATPNPTMGFMLLYKRDQVVFVDMKVEDAIRFIVSCGVMFDGFNPPEKEK